jgi:hypothetical protein
VHSLIHAAEPHACGRATDFPAVTGTIVAPLDCTEEEEAEAAEMFGLATWNISAVCRRRHAKALTRQARALAPDDEEHVLLYPIEASTQLHTMFPDGSLQSGPATRLLPPPPGGGRRAVQSAGPGSQGDTTRVVRRALQAQVCQYQGGVYQQFNTEVTCWCDAVEVDAWPRPPARQVVVHAPTLATARDLLCRTYRNNSVASCCLLPGACPAGAPAECQSLCAMAVASVPPICTTLPWFSAWHAPLVELCAGVPTTAAPLAPTAVDICDAAAEAPGCGSVSPGR